jgi:putative ABC transport system permease protein
LSHLYVPIMQVPFPLLSLHIAVHTRTSAAVTARLIKHVVSEIDPTVPVFDVESMSERLAQSIGTARFSSFLASLFAGVALMLGVVGIYSVLAYIVKQRQREIAVRIAIGASRADVVGDVLRRAAILTGTGIAVGSLVAWLFSRVLANLLDGVGTHDPTIFAGSAIVFVIVGLAAAIVPAFRTTRIDPVVALTST